MRKSLWIIAMLFTAIGAPSAHADMYDLTISGTDTGSIQITETAGTITNIVGTFDGSTINSLLPTGSIGTTSAGNDNLFSPTPPYLDNRGVSFGLASADSLGDEYVQLFYSGAGIYQSFQGTCSANPGCGGPTAYGPDYITTPEPGTGFLLLSGIGLLGW
jgi:PEP-CTERM motif